MSFISRDLNPNLPKFYDDEVSEILTRLDNSLDANFGKSEAPKVKTYKQQTYRQQDYSQRHQSSFLENLLSSNSFSLGNTYSYTSYSPSFTTINVGKNGKKDEKKSEEKSLLPIILIVTVSIAIIGACSYYGGKAYAKITDTGEDLADLKSLEPFIEGTEKQIESLKYEPLLAKKLPELKKQVVVMKNIVNSGNIFTTIKNNSIQDLRLRIALAAGAAILAVGAVIASKPAMIIAGGIMLTTTIFMLVKAGSHSDSRAQNAKIASLRQNICDMQNVISQVRSALGNKITEPAEFRVDEDAVYEGTKRNAPENCSNGPSSNYPSWDEDLPENASEEERNSLRNEYLKPIFLDVQYNQPSPVYYQTQSYYQPQTCHQPYMNQFQPTYGQTQYV